MDDWYWRTRPPVDLQSGLEQLEAPPYPWNAQAFDAYSPPRVHLCLLPSSLCSMTLNFFKSLVPTVLCDASTYYRVHIVPNASFCNCT